MKTLLFIGCDAHVAAAVRDLTDLCGMRLVHAKTCPSAWQLIEGPVPFDAVVIELWPWLSRLVLLADLHERFDDLPILAVTNSGDCCQKILVEAYGARVAMPKAHLHAGGLAQAFGWSTNLVPMAGRTSSAEAKNLTGGRKSLGASPTPASHPHSMSRAVAAKPSRNRRTPFPQPRRPAEGQLSSCLPLGSGKGRLHDQTQRLGVVMEPEPGNPLEAEVVLLVSLGAHGAGDLHAL